MKKLTLPIIMLLIGFIAGYYISKGKSTATVASGTGEFKSESSISYDEAKLLVDTFGMYGLEDAKKVPGGKGSKTRSVFMPLTKLDSLVAALDAARKTDGKTDGIRIYFGRYPKFHPDGKTPYTHPFRNTIVLVSTRDTSVTVKGSTQPLRIHIDYYGAPNHKLPLHMFALDPQNQGELCPDNCDGALFVCPDPTDPTCGN